MPELMTKQDAIGYLLFMKHNVIAKSFMDIALDTAIEALKQPTIKPEVRHGRWIQQESPNGRRFNCSECGHEFTVPCSEMIDPRDYMCYLDDYCGKCGTRMNEGNVNG